MSGQELQRKSECNENTREQCKQLQIKKVIKLRLKYHMKNCVEKKII